MLHCWSEGGKQLLGDDGLLGELVQASMQGTADGDEPFTPEIVNAMQHLLRRGQRDHLQAIGLLVQLLVEHPDELAQVRAEPSLLANAVEEGLRLESPTPRDVAPLPQGRRHRWTTIPAGSMVIDVRRGQPGRRASSARTSSGSTARSPSSTWPSGRASTCVGAGLARMEVHVAVGRLLERFPAPAASGRGGRRRSTARAALPALRSLPLEFDIPGDHSHGTPGVMIVMTDIPPEEEERFNRWYDTEHVPERVAVPWSPSRPPVRPLRGCPQPAAGTVAVRRGPKYLVVYELDDVEVLHGDWAEVTARHSELSRAMYPHLTKPRARGLRPDRRLPGRRHR